jgi:hypothetical protein
VPSADAINPPQWDEFAKREFVDAANVKAEGDVVAAYVRHVTAGKEVTTLYEVDCKDDRIRVHSDTPRYIRVPVDGGGSVVQLDDGFRTIAPGSQNARIENAICGVVAQRRAEETKQQQQANCERAKHDDTERVILVKDRLTRDEGACLLGLSHGDRYTDCDKAGIPKDATVIQYLHGKGIFLECEDYSEHQ